MIALRLCKVAKSNIDKRKENETWIFC